VAKSSSNQQLAFRFSATEMRALRAWISRSYSGNAPSIHEAARAIVMQRLLADGLLAGGGSSTVAGARATTKRAPSVSGQKLASARSKRGLTQAQAASLFGVPRSTLALWEIGAKQVPARLVDVVAGWIVTGIAPAAEEIERRERRTVWARLLDED
jgi:DNA-binding XRE family transcriptional regulator